MFCLHRQFALWLLCYRVTKKDFGNIIYEDVFCSFQTFPPFLQRLLRQKKKTELGPFYQRGIYGISEMAFVTGPAPGTGCGRAAPALMSLPLDWEQSRVEAEEWTVMEVSGQNSFAWMWRQHRGESRTHSIWYAPSQWMYLYHNMWAFLYQTFVGKSNILSKTEAFFEDVWKVFSII